MQNNTLERDEKGLIKGLEYKYTPTGLVDWFSMLKPEHLYILKGNEQKVEEKYGKSIKDLNLKEVDSKYLCVLLTGLRYLAAIRGFTSVKPIINNVVYDNRYELTVACTVTCNIDWIGNFETGMKDVSYGDVGGASLSNTDSFVKKYIETIANNRAFCRAVRGFLNISVVSKDEVGPTGEVVPIKNEENESPPMGNPNLPSSILKQKLKDEKWTFDQLKRAIIKNHKDRIKEGNPEKWEKIEDIAVGDIFLILSIIEASQK